MLAHLAAMGDKSASAVSAAAVVDRSEVSRAVASLVNQGLIDRRPNPRNRRSQLLFLTDAGRRLFAIVQPERQRFFKRITADLSPAETAMLDELLLRVAQRAEALSGPGPTLAPDD